MTRNLAPLAPMSKAHQRVGFSTRCEVRRAEGLRLHAPTEGRSLTAIAQTAAAGRREEDGRLQQSTLAPRSSSSAPTLSGRSRRRVADPSQPLHRQAADAPPYSWPRSANSTAPRPEARGARSPQSSRLAHARHGAVAEKTAHDQAGRELARTLRCALGLPRLTAPAADFAAAANWR